MEPNPDMSRRDKLFGTGASLFYKEPPQVVRGEGVWLYDMKGSATWICTTMLESQPSSPHVLTGSIVSRPVTL